MSVKDKREVGKDERVVMYKGKKHILNKQFDVSHLKKLSGFLRTLMTKEAKD